MGNSRDVDVCNPVRHPLTLLLLLLYYPRSKYLYFRTKVINKIRQGCSINYLINRPFENQCICAYEHEHAHVHTRGEIEPRCFYLHKIKPSFSRCLRTSLQSCCDRFLRKCLMTQRSASSFGPAGGATARWQGVESKICLSTLSGSPLAARGCKKSCRRLRLARVMPPEALGCHDWTSHSRDTPTRGYRVRFDL